MAYEQKQNEGSLFRNDKAESETHPSHKGAALIGRVDYWLDAWVNETKEGKKYFKIKFKPKEEKSRHPAPAQSKADQPEDEIPF